MLKRITSAREPHTEIVTLECGHRVRLLHSLIQMVDCPHCPKKVKRESGFSRLLSWLFRI